MRGPAKWIMAAVVVAAIGAFGAYVFHLKGEASQLQAQVKERDQAAEKRVEAQRAEGLRATADADRVAKEKSDAETRQRQEQEQQARIAQEKSRGDAVRKREIDMKAKPAEPMQRTATAVPRAADRPSPGGPAAPVVVPMPVSAPSSQPAPMPVATSAAEAEKPAPLTVAAQLAAADRATSAGRFADAIAALKPVADAGNAQAQLRLGDMYAEGRGTARDAAAAQTWYEKAAMGGDTAAQMKLGAIFAGAAGTTRNNNIAYIWFGTAARLGVTAAQAERDRIGALLQPAERAQADKVIESKVAQMREKA
jgi:TPR repeat protein